MAARGQDGKAGKQSGGVFPQGPGVLEGHDPNPDQPVTLRNQVLERDEQAPNRKTKTNPHLDPHAPHVDSGLQAPAFPTEVEGQKFGGKTVMLL